MSLYENLKYSLAPALSISLFACQNPNIASFRENQIETTKQLELAVHENNDLIKKDLLKLLRLKEYNTQCRIVYLTANKGVECILSIVNEKNETIFQDGQKPIDSSNYPSLKELSQRINIKKVAIISASKDQNKIEIEMGNNLSIK